MIFFPIIPGLSDINGFAGYSVACGEVVMKCGGVRLHVKKVKKKRVNLSLRVGVANLRYSRDDNKTIFLMTNIFDLTVMHSQEIFIVRIISVYL